MTKARRVYSIIYLSFLSIVAFSQTNLVPNPSFETYTVCPSGSSEINKAIGWESYDGTPDYYNACATGSVGVPNNFGGYQLASSGNAYTGAFIYSGGYREFIGAQLITTLVIGQKYFVSVMVNRCDNKAVTFDYATNNPGVKFSTVPCSQANPLPTNNFAHVYSNTIITDSINWTLVSGSFVADSAYKYIALGNFFNDANTNTVGSGSFQLAYYYFDDVCVSTDSLLCNSFTGIHNPSTNHSFIKIYPNPVSHKLYIENPYKNEKYEIMNIMGTTVKQGFCNGNKSTIEVSDLPNGLYFVMVREKKTKLIISH